VNAAPAILGLIVFILPILVALKFCDWRVVISFAISIVLVPIFFVSLTHLYMVNIQNEESSWDTAGIAAKIFILASVPIYFVLVLPLYHYLKTLQFPLSISFPLVITAIAFSIFLLLVTKPWGLKEVLIIIGCSVFHAFVILFGIALLKKWFP
jgi:hypothetical protein